MRRASGRISKVLSLVQTWIEHLLLLVVLFFILLPFYWLVVSSLKPTREIFSLVPTWWPSEPTLTHYQWVFGPTAGELRTYFVNTFVSAGGAALLVGLLAVPAAYALSRYVFPGKTLMAMTILLLPMFQGPVVIIAWYYFGLRLGLLDSPALLILAYVSLSLPFAVWMLVGFFDSVPKEMADAAAVDGATPLQTLVRIYVPLVAPGISAIMMYSFILAWNDFIYALILTQSDASKTIQIGIADLLSFFGQRNWGGLMATSVLAALPVIVVFFFVERYFTEGLAQGGVKG